MPFGEEGLLKGLDCFHACLLKRVSSPSRARYLDSKISWEKQDSLLNSSALLTALKIYMFMYKYFWLSAARLDAIKFFHFSISLAMYSICFSSNVCSKEFLYFVAVLNFLVNP